MERTVITIGRQFGSNGREIGRRLANRLNYQFYDKELLNEAAKASGMSTGILKSLDEKPNRSFLYNLVMDPYSYTFTSNGYQANLNQQAFQATYDTIKTLADKGPCVIVGRCADRILNDSINIFVHANIKKRMERTLELEPGTEGGKALEERIKEVDKKRKEYYQYYTGSIWGRAQNYHLCLDSGEVGVDGCIRAVLAYMGEIELLNEFVEGRVGEDD